MPLAYQELAACRGVVMVANSEAGMRDYARWLGLPTDRFVLKRNGVDPAAAKRAGESAVTGLRYHLGIPAHAEIVGSIFRFHREKRPLFWVQAAAKIAVERPHCHFVVFGEFGPLRDQALALAARLGLGGRVHFRDAMNDSALAISLFDVFMLTSEFEGVPNAILEAVCLGVPVVATDAGGTAEAISEGVTGYVVRNANPEDVAKKVVAILREPRRQVDAVAPGHAFVAEKFGLERMLDETIALYGLKESELNG
jgi:glycosyltransferase involved in cell wall biosynthesis